MAEAPSVAKDVHFDRSKPISSRFAERQLIIVWEHPFSIGTLHRYLVIGFPSLTYHTQMLNFFSLFKNQFARH